MRILFNPMYGSGIHPLSVLLSETRCTVDIVNQNIDAYFGGKCPAPNEKTLNRFSSMVVEGEYDLGIAIDGDGDRLGIIDSDGSYINANEILCILYYYLHEYKHWKGPVVRNVATTHMLDKMAKDFGESCYEVPVGFKHISSGITKHNAILGGESSGGLTVRGHINGKDAIYATMLFIEALCNIGITTKEVVKMFEKKYGKHIFVEDNLKFKEEQKEKYQDMMFNKKLLPEFENIKEVCYLDGCKVYFEDGSFVICRFSGTEPLLRIFAEAKDEITAKKYIEAFENLLNRGKI